MRTHTNMRATRILALLCELFARMSFVRPVLLRVAKSVNAEWGRDQKVTLSRRVLAVEMKRCYLRVCAKAALGAVIPAKTDDATPSNDEAEARTYNFTNLVIGPQ